LVDLLASQPAEHHSGRAHDLALPGEATKRNAWLSTGPVSRT
jgi:hypothetical protein